MSNNLWEKILGANASLGLQSFNSLKNEHFKIVIVCYPTFGEWCDRNRVRTLFGQKDMKSIYHPQATGANPKPNPRFPLHEVIFPTTICLSCLLGWPCQ